MKLTRFIELVKDYPNFRWSKKDNIAIIYIGNYLKPIALEIKENEEISRVTYSDTFYSNNKDGGIILLENDITTRTVNLVTKIVYCPLESELEIIKRSCEGLEWIVEDFEDLLERNNYIVDFYNSDFLLNKYRDPQKAKGLKKIRSYIQQSQNPPFHRITFGYDLLGEVFEISKDDNPSEKFFNTDQVELAKIEINEIIRSNINPT